MAGRAGASQDAPVSCNAGKANPVRFRPHEISLSSGGHNKPLQETLYGYNPHL
ncbi:ash family protein [Escherichia coli]|uniref:ash family protein n=1 Tax=Escherichia coli TaxID=562 RepID=UPI00201CC582|nr:ash family protein [Escherichia coli]